MEPRSRILVYLALAAALCVPAPERIRTALDGWRADALGRLARLLRPSEPVLREAPRSRSVLVRRDHVPVIWGPQGSPFLVVGAGHDQGLRRGQFCAVEGALLGCIDRVERDLARVRLARHPRSRYGAVIAGPDGAPRQRLLLAGDGSAWSEPRGGRLVEEPSLGLLALRPGVETLRVGVVERRPDSGRPAIRLDDVLADRAESLTVHEPDGGARLEIEARPLFDDLEVRVAVAAGGGLGRSSVLVDAGGAAGLRSGATASLDGVLVGRIGRCGRDAAWLELGSPGETLLADGAPDEPLLRARDGAKGLTRARRANRGEPWPAGLAPARAETPQPAVGAAVTVHVFRHPEQLARLVRTLGR